MRVLLARSFLVVLLGLFLSAASVSGQTGSDDERYYRLELGGQPAGWLVERTVEQETDAGRLLVTEMETRMELSRAGTATAVEMFSRFVETPSHQPVSGQTRQTLGAGPLETAFRFVDDEVLVSEPGGTTRRRELGPKTWLTPVEASEHVTRQVRRAYSQAEEDGGVEFAFEVRRLELLTGLEPVTGRYVLQDADDPTEIDGRKRSAGRWATSESYAPLLTTLAWIDGDGVLLRTEASMMGTQMVMVLTEDDPRAEAKSQASASGSAMAQLPEMLVQTFVRPDRAIEAPRSVRRGVYRLRVDGLDAAVLQDVVPTAGVQRTELEEEGRGLLVTVDLGRELVGEEPEDLDVYLQPSRYLDFESEAVKSLLEGWRRETPTSEIETAGAKAESLRRFVADHLDDKNLGTVLGTASDTAKSGSGDCTEHAVLLAALLRAEGIPSRIAVGLVYAERFAGEQDLFAYHMWTQARPAQDGRQAAESAKWVDLDATLHDATPFDATHILFATSPLAEDGVPLLGAGSEAIFGRLSIEVVKP